MRGYEVKFNVYAESQDEADAVSQAFKDLISDNARKGVAVTAARIVEAVRRWGNNQFIRNRITQYFNGR